MNVQQEVNNESRFIRKKADKCLEIGENSEPTVNTLKVPIHFGLELSTKYNGFLKNILNLL